MSETLLPPNATPAERALEQTYTRIDLVQTPARALWDPMTCPADILPWLAWAFTVDEWSEDWSEAQKRNAIASSYTVHRQKGTIGAVRQALAALGINLDIVEWFQEDPPGPPYTFRIKLTVDQTGADQTALPKLIAVVNATKNLRSHLLSVDPIVQTTATPFVAGVLGCGNEITILSGS